jgi:uncharacterized protein (DUF2147 family)
MKKWILLASLGFSSVVFAQMTPVGTWVSVDEKTGERKAEITITESGNVLTGKITKRLLKDVDPNAVCDKCTDDRKGKPILGLELIRGMKKDGDTWEGGTIIDPESGKIYKATMEPVEDGKKLNVRGFIGIKALGRTQTWLRTK